MNTLLGIMSRGVLSPTNRKSGVARFARPCATVIKQKIEGSAEILAAIFVQISRSRPIQLRDLRAMAQLPWLLVEV
jgi:hypothetical protein